MRRGSNRGNNGYIGVNQANVPTTGVVGINKTYNVELKEIPQYPYPNTRDTFGITLTAVNQRPVEWPVLPDVTAGSQQIVGLFAVFNHDSNVCAVQIQGAYTVDWGDGTSAVNYTSNTVATKRYDTTTYAGLTSSVVTSRGGKYKTALIRITPQAGQNFTTVNFAATPTGITGWPTTTTTHWLDIRMGAPNLTQLIVSNWYYNAIANTMLEQFEYVGTAPSLTSFTFISCSNLRKIIAFPIPGNITSFNSVFHTCVSLQEIPANIFLNFGNVTSMSYMFNSCGNLRYFPVNYLNTIKCTSMIGPFSGMVQVTRLPKMTTQNATTMDTMFYDCRSLEEIPFPVDTGKATNLANMFSNCYNLKSVSGLSTGACTSFYYMFSSCSKLQYAPQLNTSKGSDFTGMFNGCTMLKTIPQYDYSLATNLSYFNRYGNIQTCPNFNTGLSLTNTSYMFEYNRSLLEAPLITNMTNVTDTTNMFNGCENIRVIPGITFGNPTSSTNTFSTYTASGLSHLKSLASMQAKGISFNIDLRNAVLGSTALNEIYTNLATVGVSGANAKTIQVTGNWGYTASNRITAISKGWNVS